MSIDNDKVLFKYFIGGALIDNHGSDGWRYAGGIKYVKEWDADHLFYMILLDICKEAGYLNPWKLWYRAVKPDMYFTNSLMLVENTFNGFANLLSLCYNAHEVEIYVEHSEHNHPYLTVDRPELVCQREGIDEQGRRKGKATVHDNEEQFMHDKESKDGSSNVVDLTEGGGFNIRESSCAYHDVNIDWVSGSTDVNLDVHVDVDVDVNGNESGDEEDDIDDDGGPENVDNTSNDAECGVENEDAVIVVDNNINFASGKEVYYNSDDALSIEIEEDAHIGMEEDDGVEQEENNVGHVTTRLSEYTRYGPVCKPLHFECVKPAHTCDVAFSNSGITYKYMANHLVKTRGKSAHELKPSDMKEGAKIDFDVNITPNQASWAKGGIMRIFEGNVKEEFARLENYAATLRKTNPGSSVQVEFSNRVFKRMYVCFHALKEGFKSCRPIIGLDGCFLKGSIRGQLLAAVGWDANNQMFPVAWAMVTRENMDS
ncbi:hypothetical protein Tsubulata_039672 [Turnera subulata]|uniref:PB1-like domain-containing protein n=1 Tax=Turnera subulata TaxID=218843 RepID=A0A9Q0J4B6_9ROSI|nr:hypothetical protein Tsubulata_039672 [Turnera subulata]